MANRFQALERLEGVDLVLLDVMMPRMSGYEVCRKLRERFSRSDLPVIFVTAKSRPEDLNEGFTAGGNDYLVKPVAMDELLARIEIPARARARLSVICRDSATLGAGDSSPRAGCADR